MELPLLHSEYDEMLKIFHILPGIRQLWYTNPESINTVLGGSVNCCKMSKGKKRA